jgi:hypothetical protein
VGVYSSPSPQDDKQTFRRVGSESTTAMTARPVHDCDRTKGKARISGLLSSGQRDGSRRRFADTG